MNRASLTRQLVFHITDVDRVVSRDVFATVEMVQRVIPSGTLLTTDREKFCALPVEQFGPELLKEFLTFVMEHLELDHERETVAWERHVVCMKALKSPHLTVNMFCRIVTNEPWTVLNVRCFLNHPYNLQHVFDDDTPDRLWETALFTHCIPPHELLMSRCPQHLRDLVGVML